MSSADYRVRATGRLDPPPYCNKCGAAVTVAITRRGRPIILNRRGNTTGDIVLTGKMIRSKEGQRGPEARRITKAETEDILVRRFSAHRTTCPARA